MESWNPQNKQIIVDTNDVLILGTSYQSIMNLSQNWNSHITNTDDIES